MGVFLINGCGAKEEVSEIPSETFVNEVLSSLEEQTTVANETQPMTSDELQLETFVQSEESAKPESASEPEPNSEQETQTTQTAPPKTGNANQTNASCQGSKIHGYCSCI